MYYAVERLPLVRPPTAGREEEDETTTGPGKWQREKKQTQTKAAATRGLSVNQTNHEPGTCRKLTPQAYVFKS